jgi:glycosyltransferase involved in cell wall biosynthesis
MKIILQILDYASPYKGNFIPTITNLERHLNNYGYGMVYLLPKSASNIDWVKDLQKDGKTIYFIDRSFFSKQVKLPNVKDLLRVIKKHGVNIIHTHFVAYNYTLVLMKILLLTNVIIVGNFMNEFHPPFNIYRRFKIFITNTTFHCIIAASAAVKDSLLKTGINSDKVEIVYNALDTEHLQVVDRIDFKNRNNQIIILMFGWTFHRKGVDIAINAIKELVDEGRNIRLVIAMAGGLEIIENEIINQLGNVPFWICLQGPTSNVASYYNSSDIFLSSSREEGFTYSVLEAAYCMPLIIASEIGGHPLDIPFIGKFESENYVMLKSSIIELSQKSLEEKQKIKAIQKKYVVDNYNPDQWSESIIKVYLKLLK